MPVRPTLPPLLALFASLTLAGCTIHHTPKEFELEEAWPKLSGSDPVAVRIGDAPSGKRAIELAGTTMTLDLLEYTKALVDRVEKALESEGVAISGGAPKSLEFEVVYANILPGAGRFHCLIDVTVRAGNGYVHGYQARDKSYDSQKACNAALSRTALECLRDPKIQEYLRRSSG